jgi:hypothetical protein
MRDAAHEGKMDLKSLKDIPPWDWPAGAGAMFLDVMRDGQAAESAWPAVWTFSSDDRAAFIRTVNRFSSNYAPTSAGCLPRS